MYFLMCSFMHPDLLELKKKYSKERKSRLLGRKAILAAAQRTSDTMQHTPDDSTRPSDMSGARSLGAHTRCIPPSA